MLRVNRFSGLLLLHISSLCTHADPYIYKMSDTDADAQLWDGVRSLSPLRD